MLEFIIAVFIGSSVLADSSADCSAHVELKRPDPNAPYGSIHSIVGKDGAFVITLQRTPERFEHAADRLREAGIIATPFPAADKDCDPIEDITRGCLLQNHDRVLPVSHMLNQGLVQNCSTLGAAACTESHHRALEVAQYRHWNWTLIMEDDAVPVDAATFDSSFREVWPKIPSWAKMVRLGFCDFLQEPSMKPNLLPVVLPSDEGSSGMFRITGHINSSQPLVALYNRRGYASGGCLTAYMVRRDVLPELLGLFPCTCLVDCCFEYGLFDQPVGPNGETWGELNLVSLDISGSAGAAATRGWNKHKGMVQFGPIVQDNRELPTTRTFLKKVGAVS